MTTSTPLPLTGGLTAHGQTAGTLATSCGRSRVVPGALRFGHSSHVAEGSHPVGLHGSGARIRAYVAHGLSIHGGRAQSSTSFMAKTIANERRGGSSDRENEMSAPETLASVVEEQWIELVVLRNRAMADNQVSPEEGLRLVAAIDRLHQPVTTLTVSWSVASSLFRGAEGIYGYRFTRSLKQLWNRRGNVTPIGQGSQRDIAA